MAHNIKPLKDYSGEFSPTDFESFEVALVETEKGRIVIELYPKEAPNTVANFAHLANSGFYDGLKFHRVIPGFMAQGGCPQGTGVGGPDWRIECELKENPNKHKRGALSMAHAGRDTGGSQFFITFVATPHLDGEHTVFGQIAEKDTGSFKVLDSIDQNDKIKMIRVGLRAAVDVADTVI